MLFTKSEYSYKEKQNDKNDMNYVFARYIENSNTNSW